MNKYKVTVIETSYWHVTVEGETESIAADNAVVLFQENSDSLLEVGDEYVPGFLEARVEGKIA